jgi:hypothetical protein
MSSENAQVSMSHRSSHSAIGVDNDDDRSSSSREFEGEISGDNRGRLTADTSYSILKDMRS